MAEKDSAERSAAAIRHDEEDPQEATATAADDGSASSASNNNKLIRIEQTSRPGSSSCCRRNWRPTHATVTVDGERYEWNARAHRKLRHAVGSEDKHPAKHRLHVWCWEPHIVTWHICWIGVIANTLWVVNGVYAVWPEQANSLDPENITFITGVVGAFLFIVGGYLGYVEAINQTYQELQLPTLDDTSKEPRTFRRPHHTHYGEPDHALGAKLTPVDENKLLSKGYPLVYNDNEDRKGLIMAKDLFKASAEKGDDALVGKHLKVQFGGRMIGVDITSITAAPAANVTPHDERNHEGYIWWTWQPDLEYIGITNALVFFVATIVFFIPAVVWYPMGNNDSPTSSVVFWGYILQIIPSIAFVYVGLATMAEATGSWVKPQFDNIGWWIGFFNTVGGIGFLLYPILYLPEEVNQDRDNLAKWGAAMATFWGSAAFWVAGIIQCIEFSSQHPIQVKSKQQ